MLIFFRGTGPVAAAIRWQTRGEYAHVGWVCGDGSIIEAHAATGVARSESPFAHNAGIADLYAIPGMCDGLRADIERRLKQEIGKKYDWCGCARFLSRVNADNPERWFCSELIAEKFSDAGYSLLETDAWRVSPVTLSWSPRVQRASLGVDKWWWREHYGMTRQEWMEFDPAMEAAR